MEIKPPACRRPNSDYRSPSAFTLIELLVVIAIIGLLAAILFPVFGRVRENAKRSSCLSNMKQIMMGTVQYTQDNDERIPILVSVTVPGEYPWFQRLQPYVKSKSVFHCPSDLDPLSIKISGAVPAADKFPTSYAANIYSSIYLTGASFVNTSGLNLSQVLLPSTTVYITEAGATSGGSGGILLNTDGSATTPKNGCAMLDLPHGGGATGPDTNYCGPNPRHGGFAMVGFYDGHAKAMIPKKWYYSVGGITPWMDPRIGGS